MITKPTNGGTHGNVRTAVVSLIDRTTTNITSLLALTGIPTGEVVHLLGYTSAGDGGGQTLYYSSGSSATINGGTVFPGIGGTLSFDSSGVFNGTAGTGRYLAANTDTFYAKLWGCLGDGSDDSVNLLRIMNAAVANRVWIDLQGGSYTCSVNWDKLQGSHALRMRRGTLVTKTSSDYALQLKASDSSAVSGSMQFDNVTFDGAENSANYGLRQFKNHFARFNSCSFKGTLAGIRSDQAFGNTYSQCTIGDSASKYGYIGVGGTGTGTYNGDNAFLSCYYGSHSIFSVNDNTLATGGVHGNLYDNCTMQGPAALKIYEKHTGTGVRQTTIRSCYMEAPRTTTVNASDIGLGTIDPANGNLVQFVDRCAAYIDQTSTHGTIGCFDSSLTAECVAASDQIIFDRTADIITHRISGPSNDLKVLHHDHFALMAEHKNTITGQAWAWRVRGLAQGWNTSVTNYFIKPQFTDTDPVTAAGGFSPTITREIDPAVQTGVVKIVATAGDRILMRGRADSNQFFVDPDVDGYLLMQWALRSEAAGSFCITTNRQTTNSGSFTSFKNWTSYRFLQDETVARTKTFARIDFLVDGTYYLANCSATIWDSASGLGQKEMWAFAESNLIAGSGTGVIPTSPTLAYTQQSPADMRLALRKVPNVLSFNATQNWDLANGLIHTLTATGNFTLNLPSNAAIGESGVLYVTQDGTGSRVITLASGFKAPAGASIVLSTGANKVDRIEYYVRDTSVIDLSLTKDWA